MAETAVETLAEAHRIGTFEAEQLDDALRALERRDREVIAAAVAAQPEPEPPPPPPPPLPPPPDRTQELADLQVAYEQALEKVQRLGEFERQLARSRAWRVLQAIRRPFGRAW